MKKSVAAKIQELLASMSGNDTELNTAEQKEKDLEPFNPISAKNIGKFCRMLPISIFNLIRPAKTTT